MNTVRLLRVLAISLVWISCSSCDSAEAVRTVDSVLAKWEAASQRCQILDAQLKVYRYDDVFGGEQPKISQGRFYYEAPHIGRYEIEEGAKGSTNDWPHLSEAIVWQGKQTLWIEGSRRSCRRLSAEELQSFLGTAESSPEDWLSRFLRSCLRGLQGPEQFLPLVVRIRAAEVRQRFDVAIEHSDERIELKAVPKQPWDNAVYREIDIILNAKTYMTYATRMISPDGKDRIVYVLYDQKVNQRPTERDQLIDPDLSGLRVTEEP